MKTPIRILISEDEPAVRAKLVRMYAEAFSARGFEPSVEEAATVEQTRQLAKAAISRPYDFVSLDVNLGDRTLTGLDVLKTMKRFHSAWMVALLTGVETDATLDQNMGEKRGETLRKQLRRDAYSCFPAERLLVVEKPAKFFPTTEAQHLLENRVQQIALVYEEVSRLRYIFRKVEVTSLKRIQKSKGQRAERRFTETTAIHWQIRFNCGDIRTLPDKAGFATLELLLSTDRGQSVTPEEALAKEPKQEHKKKDDGDNPYRGPDCVAQYFTDRGIDWRALADNEQDNVIRAALSTDLHRYVELREFQDQDDLSCDEDEELQRITAKLGPLVDAAETQYQRTKPAEERPPLSPEELENAQIAEADLHGGRGGYDRKPGRRGLDSVPAEDFRQRMKRVKDCLRENGFADFAEHIEAFVHSTGANWSYNPPSGVSWTTA